MRDFFVAVRRNFADFERILVALGQILGIARDDLLDESFQFSAGDGEIFAPVFPRMIRLQLTIIINL